MKSFFGLIVLAVFVMFGASAVAAQDTMMKKDDMKKSDGNPMVGGAAMYKNKNIVENAMNSADHTTLVAAVKQADLVATLQGKGPFTVFAPVNAAFEKLPAGVVEMAMKSENKAMLAKVLTYHVVAGKMSGKDIMKKIKKGEGKLELTTVAGAKLWVSMQGNSLVITDELGSKGMVTIADVKQSNGVIHVVDTVFMPKM